MQDTYRCECYDIYTVQQRLHNDRLRHAYEHLNKWYCQSKFEDGLNFKRSVGSDKKLDRDVKKSGEMAGKSDIHIAAEKAQAEIKSNVRKMSPAEQICWYQGQKRKRESESRGSRRTFTDHIVTGLTMCLCTLCRSRNAQWGSGGRHAPRWNQIILRTRDGLLFYADRLVGLSVGRTLTWIKRDSHNWALSGSEVGRLRIVNWNCEL